MSARLSLSNYLDEVAKILTSKKEINDQMSIALYQQGIVLERKYRLLSYAYSLFIIGMAMGTLAFILMMFIY